jgi:hypothetical protein
MDGLRQFGTTELFLKASYWVLNKIDQKTSTQQTVPGDYFPRSVDLYRENLERMILLAHFYNFKIGLFLQPLIGVDGKGLTPEEKGYRVDEMPIRVAFYRDARVMLENLRKKYARDGVVSVHDASQCFQNIKETVYEDSGHLNLRGNQIVAEDIVRKLKEKHLL